MPKPMIFEKDRPPIGNMNIINCMRSINGVSPWSRPADETERKYYAQLVSAARRVASRAGIIHMLHRAAAPAWRAAKTPGIMEFTPRVAACAVLYMISPNVKHREKIAKNSRECHLEIYECYSLLMRFSEQYARRCGG